MFYAAIAPLLPHYSHELGLSKTAAGVLTASYAAGTLLGALPSGWVVSKVGPKIAVVTGLALLSISGLVFGLGKHIVVLDSARFVQGIGGAFCWTGALSWVVVATSGDRRGAVVGSVISVALFGVVFGPAVGGAAVVFGPVAVFGAVSATGCALACWAVTIPGVPSPESTNPRQVGRAILSRPVLVGTTFLLVPALFSGVIQVLVPLRFAALGAGGIVVATAFLAAGLAEALGARIFGELSDRRGRALPISIGLIVIMVTAPILSIPDTPLILAAVLVVAVVGTALFWAPAAAMLSESAERRQLNQGFAFALVNVAWAGGLMVGGGAGLASLKRSVTAPHS